VSIPSNGRRARRRALALISAGAVVAGVLSGVPAATAAGDNAKPKQVKPQAASFDAGRYIVILRDPGATQYGGGEGNLAATRVAPGRQFNARTDNARAYVNHIRGQQNQLARSVGATVERHYTLAANGFSAELTGRQALKLSNDRDVLLVQKDERQHLDTWNTPQALGLSGKAGAWKQEAGGRGKAGAGVVVGVIDSGIWPESKSFSGNKLSATPRSKWDISRDGETVSMEKADGGVFEGRCQTSHEVAGVPVPAEDWSLSDCTTKLIGARYYPEEFLEGVAVEDRSPTEVVSTRDGGGHGTHTASTAAGNPVDKVKVEDVKFGEVVGMAPAAKIAAYKVCFDDNDPDTGDCYNGAILAAIDDAIADGVDVINFSISGATDTVLDATEFAFEGAAEAGIFVATSAGNAGPDESTVAHNSPWLTTVAASTHYNFENTVVLGNGKKIRGASVSRTPLPKTKLVSSVDVGAAGADPEDVRLCVSGGNLAPAKVEGKIVVCQRGVNDRVDKSLAVKQAGGVGMILANVTPGSLDADFHSVPTIHVSDTDGSKIFNYLKRQGKKAKAAFKLGDVTGLKPTPVPQVAGFSSRGPALANDSDLIKPDIAAPGQSVLAAVAPPSNHKRKYDLYSGTSMASPHIAGLAAFMMGVEKKWTPMMVKSAMMTSAKSLRNAKNGVDKDAFAQGAGLVRPNKMFDPGLFVLSTPLDWRRFYQGQGLDWGQGYEPLAAKDLNGPSMAQGQVTSETKFTREFTSTMKGTWKVSVKVPGFKAVTRKKLVAKRKGDRESLTVRFSRTTAPLGQFSSGFLVLDGPTRVRLPITLRPVSVAAPGEVSGEGVAGSTAVDIRAGFTGNLDVAVAGLAEAESDSQTTVGPNNSADDEAYYCVEVTDGSKAARFDLDAADDDADMDLYVYQAADSACADLVAFSGQSATGSADEQVTLLDPAPGYYFVVVDPFAASPGQSSLDWRFDFYDVNPATQVGGLAADPNPVPVVNNQETSFDATWSGLEEDNRYLGMFDYDGALSPTFLTVDTSATP
jgi:hypothetical protein